MQYISLPSGSGAQSACVPDDVDIRTIDFPKTEPTADIMTMIKDAMRRPIGSDTLERIVRPDDTVVILVNDQTRPGPTKEMLRGIMGSLEKSGVKDGQITLVFATGTHRAPTEPEKRDIVGEYYDRLKMVVHDCNRDEGLTLVGNTEKGMPVYVNSVVANASCVIATGLIAPHHAAGFSGGRKSIVPGVAGIRTLKIHHSFPYRPMQPAMGFVDGNDFHSAAVEAAKMVSVKFIVNAVQNPHKQNVAFVAGDMEAAHEAGMAICRRLSEVHIPSLADIIVTSPGGTPRDINLYQSQKGLSAAEPLLTQGGVFILVAECPDGIGEGVFRTWMEEAATPEEVIERFRAEGYSVGSNKAFMFARALTKGSVIIVSKYLNGEILEKMHIRWAPDLQVAVDEALRLRPAKRMIVLPHAVSLIPRVTGGKA